MKILLFGGLLIIIISACKMAFRKSGVAQPDDNKDMNRSAADSTDLAKYAGALYPVKRDGKWGYLNNRLKLVIPARFIHADDFNEGRAGVSDYVNADGTAPKELYGYIDSTGKLIVDFKYNKVMSFSEGIAVVVKNGKYGYINTAGEELVSPGYEEAASFSEGLAAVKLNGKNGFIDKTGKIVIEPSFSRAPWVSEFSEGLAPVYFPDNSAGYIDKKGKLIIPASFSYVGKFSEGLALVQPKGTTKFGYINKEGEMVIEPIYELSLPFSEGVATVKMSRPDGNTYFRIINKVGIVIADNLNYGFTGIFREGLAGVESSNYRWGFIDKTGKEVIAPRFASARLFKNGLSMIQAGSLFTNLSTGYIDKEGKIVVAAQK